MHGFTDKLPAIEMDASGPRCHWLMHADVKLSAFGVPRLPAVGPLRWIPARLPSEISVTRWGLSLGWIRQNLDIPGGFRFRTQTLATRPVVLGAMAAVVLAAVNGHPQEQQ